MSGLVRSDAASCSAAGWGGMRFQRLGRCITTTATIDGGRGRAAYECHIIGEIES